MLHRSLKAMIALAMLVGCSPAPITPTTPVSPASIAPAAPVASVAPATNVTPQTQPVQDATVNFDNGTLVLSAMTSPASLHASGEKGFTLVAGQYTASSEDDQLLRHVEVTFDQNAASAIQNVGLYDTDGNQLGTTLPVVNGVANFSLNLEVPKGMTRTFLVKADAAFYEGAPVQVIGHITGCESLDKTSGILRILKTDVAGKPQLIQPVEITAVADAPMVPTTTSNSVIGRMSLHSAGVTYAAVTAVRLKVTGSTIEKGGYLLDPQLVMNGQVLAQMKGRIDASTREITFSLPDELTLPPNFGVQLQITADATHIASGLPEKQSLSLQLAGSSGVESPDNGLSYYYRNPLNGQMTLSTVMDTYPLTVSNLAFN